MLVKRVKSILWNSKGCVAWCCILFPAFSHREVRFYETLMDEANYTELYQSLSNFTVEDPFLQGKDHRRICETLFEQLHSTFDRFFSALPLHHIHDLQYRPLPPPNSRLWPVVKNLCLILRCCLLLLTIPHSDQKFLLLKCRSLLRILNSFLSINVTEHHGVRFRNFLSDVDLDLDDSCRPFLRSLLEVGFVFT